MSRLIFHDDDTRFTDEVRLRGLGEGEVMPAGHVSRQRGLPNLLLVLFHDPVEVVLKGERQEVPEGTLALWDRNRPHWFGNAAQEWSHSWIVFDGVSWRGDSEGLKPYFERPIALGGDDHIGRYFRSLMREFDAFAKPSLRIVAGNIDLLLHEISRGAASEAWQRLRQDPVETALRWIRERLGQPLPVCDIARAAGLSPSRLQQLFRSRLGFSVQQHVERQRLQEARYWLMHSGLRIGEIAERVGYADAFYFSRRFRRAFGESPAKHRATRYELKEADLPKAN